MFGAATVFPGRLQWGSRELTREGSNTPGRSAFGWTLLQWGSREFTREGSLTPPLRAEVLGLASMGLS